MYDVYRYAWGQYSAGLLGPGIHIWHKLLHIRVYRLKHITLYTHLSAIPPIHADIIKYLVQTLYRYRISHTLKHTGTDTHTHTQNRHTHTHTHTLSLKEGGFSWVSFSPGGGSYLLIHHWPSRRLTDLPQLPDVTTFDKTWNWQPPLRGRERERGREGEKERERQRREERESERKTKCSGMM